jgi:hypothetical protein
MNLNEDIQDIQDLPQWYVDDQIATIQYMENEYSLGDTAISNNYYAIWVNYDMTEKKYIFYILKNNDGIWVLNREMLTDLTKDVKMNNVCKERYGLLKIENGGVN